MGVELMIYMYGAVCAAMIIFNIVYNFISKSQRPRLNRRAKKLTDRIKPQLERLKDGKRLEQEHLDWLFKKLKRIGWLLALESVLDSAWLEDSELYELREHTDSYLIAIQPVMLYLAGEYIDSKPLHSGYFTYFLSKHGVPRQNEIESLQGLLLEYLKKENFYCRVNSLKALYRFASAENVVRAILTQDDGRVFLHEKILTEGLLSFTGNHDELIKGLWRSFERLSERSQLAVLNYIRFKSPDFKEQMYGIMQDKSRPKELRLSAVRYLGKYSYAPALEPLIAMLGDKDPENWEYATVAASSLAGYSGLSVIEALKDALFSGNWYIRLASASSLERLGVEYADVIDIMSGSDRYAREMMSYRLETRKLQRAGVE